MKKIFSILIIASTVFFVTPFYNNQNTQASSDTIILEAGIPSTANDNGLSIGEHKSSDVTPAKYISFIYMFMVGLVGIAAFASLVFYGIVWIYSGVSEKKSEAMEGIKNTFIGILLALSAFIILNTINPRLVTLKDPQFVSFSAEDAAKNQPIKILGNRVEGYYYFSYKDQNTGPKEEAIYRYSFPYTSIESCNSKREAFLSGGPDRIAFECAGYRTTDNFFYEAFNPTTAASENIFGFTTVEDCINASAEYKASKGGGNWINPDKDFQVGCYDRDGFFYDANLTPEKPFDPKDANWCFTSTIIETGYELSTCRPSEAKCISAREPFAERPTIYSPVTACAQIK